MCARVAVGVSWNGLASQATDLRKERSFVATALLPALFKCESGDAQPQYLSSLWAALCRMQRSPAPDVRHQTVALVCVFLDAFLPPPAGALDLRAEPAFWQLLQSGLRGPDPFVQKQCMFLLKKVLKGVPHAEGVEYCRCALAAIGPGVRTQLCAFGGRGGGGGGA